MRSFFFLITIAISLVTTGNALKLTSSLSILLNPKNQQKSQVQDTKALLTKLINKMNLSSDETESLWSIIFTDCDAALVGAILVALRAKGETPDEIAGMVRAMKKVCVPGAILCNTYADYHSKI